jgi:hypothetical protein
MLVDPDDGAVDDHILEIGIVRQSFKNLIEHAASDPPAEPLEDRVPIPESLGKVAPRRPDTHNPENRFDEKPVVRSRAARILDFSWKKRRNPLPLIIAQYTTFQGHLLLATSKQISAELRTPLAIYQSVAALQSCGNGKHACMSLTMRRSPRVNQEVLLRATFLG